MCKSHFPLISKGWPLAETTGSPTKLNFKFLCVLSDICWWTRVTADPVSRLVPRLFPELSRTVCKEMTPVVTAKKASLSTVSDLLVSQSPTILFVDVRCSFDLHPVAEQLEPLVPWQPCFTWEARRFRPFVQLAALERPEFVDLGFVHGLDLQSTTDRIISRFWTIISDFHPYFTVF